MSNCAVTARDLMVCLSVPIIVGVLLLWAIVLFGSFFVFAKRLK